MKIQHFLVADEILGSAVSDLCYRVIERMSDISDDIVFDKKINSVFVKVYCVPFDIDGIRDSRILKKSTGVLYLNIVVPKQIAKIENLLEIKKYLLHSIEVGICGNYGNYGDGNYGDGNYGDGNYGDGNYGDGNYGDGNYGDSALY